jgi:hypothetical protein
MKLILPTCVPSNSTLNIWRPDIDRGALGRGEALRFILVNSWHRGSTTKSSRRACSSCSECRHSQQRTMMIFSTRLNNKKSGARRRSWAPGSRTRSAMHDDDGLQVPSEPQEFSDHVSSGSQATSYERSDRWSDTTTDQDFIDYYPIIRVSAHWDMNNEAWRISNREAINSSNKYSTINRSMMIKFGSSSSSCTPLQPILQHSPTAGVNLQDKSGLTLQNRCALSDQQATCHHLRRNLFKSNQQGTASSNDTAWYLHPYQKSATSLTAVIAIMNESDHQINFNSLKKYVTSLPAVIAIMDESDRKINFNSLKKSTTSLSMVIRILGSPLGPHLENDLVTYIYSTSTPIANMDMSDCQISFNSLNKSVISLSAAIEALDSPLRPYSESDLETDLYSGSTMIAIKTSPIAGWLCPSSQLWRDGSIRLQRPLQVIKHLADLSLSWGWLTQ